MILDFLCILVAILSRTIRVEKLNTNIRKIVINRYLESNEDTRVTVNQPVELLSDTSAISKTFQISN